jgi:hypothetical protein
MSHTKDDLGRLDEDNSVNLLPLSESIRSLGNLLNTRGNDSKLFSLRNRISSVCRAAMPSGNVELPKKEWMMKKMKVQVRFNLH